jgi:hypothetical protein
MPPPAPDGVESPTLQPGVQESREHAAFSLLIIAACPTAVQASSTVLCSGPHVQKKLLARSVADCENHGKPIREKATMANDDDKDRPHRLAAHRGTLILVLGILSLVAIQILGPVAWLLGNADLREMRAGRMDPSGESQTNIGRVLGMIATLLMVVSLVIACVIVALFFGGAAFFTVGGVKN